MHKYPRLDDSEKKKPEIIHFYNESKAGDDCLDNMLRMYSTKSASRLWSVGVFLDLLDKAALNAQIIYKEAVENVNRSNSSYFLRKRDS